MTVCLTVVISDNKKLLAERIWKMIIISSTNYIFYIVRRNSMFWMLTTHPPPTPYFWYFWKKGEMFFSSYFCYFRLSWVKLRLYFPQRVRIGPRRITAPHMGSKQEKHPPSPIFKKKKIRGLSQLSCLSKILLSK